MSAPSSALDPFEQLRDSVFRYIDGWFRDYQVPVKLAYVSRMFSKKLRRVAPEMDLMDLIIGDSRYEARRTKAGGLIIVPVAFFREITEGYSPKDYDRYWTMHGVDRFEDAINRVDL